MLARASEKFPDVPARLMALQDLRAATELAGRFAGLLCVDALENVGPEDWPAVLDGFRAVLQPGSHAYLTVEQPDGAVPVSSAAAGELADGEVIEDGAYHHYPLRAAVAAWLADAQLRVVSERTGDGYWHILTRRDP